MIHIRYPKSTEPAPWLAPISFLAVNSARKRPSGAAWTLGGILALGLVLRLWGIRHGMPVAFHLDEYAHFTESAVKMFDNGLNPKYFQNPPAYTYLLHALFAIAYGVSPIGGLGGPVVEAFEGDPTTLYLIARLASTALGLGAAWVLYFAGKRLFGTGVALAATAFLTFTFLPVHYAHFALNDVPLLFPLCIGLLGLAGIVTRGSLTDYLVAGLGLGLATGTKYTAAALSVAIFAAWAIRAWDDREAAKRTFLYLLAAAGISLLAFLISNPFSLLDADKFLGDLKRQSDLSAGVSKLGTDDTSGWVYYVKTLTWGFGGIPLMLSIFGAGLALRRDWRKAAPFVLFGMLVWLFMGNQVRFYARWLMPVYPVLALFAGYAAVEIARSLGRSIAERKATTDTARIARLTTYSAVGVMFVALVSPVAHVIHNNVVLSRTDTRYQAKAWLLENVGENRKIAFELIAPFAYYNKDNERGAELAFKTYPFPRGSEIEKQAEELSPARIDEFVAKGYCYVVVGSIQKGRVTKDPSKRPNAAAYYKALDDRAEKVASFSPVRSGADLPTFNFDISYNYYPLAYARPGPEIDVYRLTEGQCAPSAEDPLPSSN